MVTGTGVVRRTVPSRNYKCLLSFNFNLALRSELLKPDYNYEFRGSQ
jgi:hypothetical protein